MVYSIKTVLVKGKTVLYIRRLLLGRLGSRVNLAVAFTLLLTVVRLRRCVAVSAIRVVFLRRAVIRGILSIVRGLLLIVIG